MPGRSTADRIRENQRLAEAKTGAAEPEYHGDLEPTYEEMAESRHREAKLLRRYELGDAAELPPEPANVNAIPPPWGSRRSQRPDPAKDAHLTDKGNGTRLASWHGEDLRHVHAWKKWLVWDGRRWVIDETGEIDRRAKAVTVRMFAEAVEEMRKIQRELEGGAP